MNEKDKLITDFLKAFRIGIVAYLICAVIGLAIGFWAVLS